MSAVQPTKVFKAGRICICLSGRMAGKKCVVLSAYDQGSRNRSFAHALVLGIEDVPKLTKKEKLTGVKKTECKVFLKHMNYSHLMPTRYVLQGELDSKVLLGERKIETPAEKAAVKKDIGAIVMQKFNQKEDKIPRELAFLKSRLRF